jgi:solute:Na+ symporter, SSS family
MTVGAVAVLLYLVALTFVAWNGRKQAESSDMFNIFGRRAGLLRATSGYLSLIGAGELVTIAQLGYDSGLSLFWFPAGISVGFLIVGIFGDTVRVRAKALNVNTLVGYVTRVFGASPGAALAIVFLVALGSLLAIQFIIGGQLLAITTGLSATVTSVIMAAVIVAYLMLGGYVAVLSTDVLRLAFLVVVVVALAVVAASRGGLSDLFNPTLFPPLPFWDGLTLFVLGFFGAVCAGDVWQTVLATKSKDVLLRSMVLAAVAFIVFGFLIGCLGVAAKHVVPMLQQDQSALVAATQSVIPPSLSALVALLIVGSVMATADTEIWVIATSVISYFKPSPRGSEKNETFHATTQMRVRVAIPVVTGVALIVGHFGADAKAIYEALLVLLTAIAPAMIAVLVDVKRPLAVNLSLWAALLSFLTMSVIFKFVTPPSYTFLPVGCSLVALVIGMVFDELSGRHTKA